jgi:hypothetical protein
MKSVKKMDCLILQKGSKRTRKVVTLDNKMLMIRKIKAGENRANFFSSLGLAPATVSTIMAKAAKMKQSAQKNINLRSWSVRYTSNFKVENMDQLLKLQVDDLRKKKKGISLTQRAIAAKARSVFDEIQQKEGGSETFAVSK